MNYGIRHQADKLTSKHKATSASLETQNQIIPGTKWRFIDTGYYSNVVALKKPVSSPRVYLLGTKTFLLNGLNKQLIDVPVQSNSITYSTSTSKYYIGTVAGLYESIDGVTFTICSTYPVTNTVNLVIQSSGNLILSFTELGDCYYSSDGISWSLKSAAGPFLRGDIRSTGSVTILTSENKASFQTGNTMFLATMSFIPSPPSVVYDCCTDGSFYMFTASSSGLHYLKTGVTMSPTNVTEPVYSCFYANGYLFFGTSEGIRVTHSTDLTNFTSIISADLNKVVFKITGFNYNYLYALSYEDDGSTGLYISRNM